jgi:adenosylcobinamide kinase/adenosylcobinamide-phosphate guanylyltransferase
VSVSVFILGGARSGKSRLAVWGLPHQGRMVFVATATARDEEMARRIARHRDGRPAHWRTVEEPLDLVARLSQLEDTCDGVIVDCLTLWTSNRLLRGDPDDAILDEAGALARLIGRRRAAFTLVSNEVGAGVHPETALGLRFRDLLGAVNQRIAAACDTVVLMVAGLPLTVKPAAPIPRPIDDATIQAP